MHLSCNAQLPQIQAEGGDRSGMVGEQIAKFPRRSGDLSSLKKFTKEIHSDNKSVCFRFRKEGLRC